VNPFSSEESHFVKTYCRILGANCQDKIDEIGAEAVDEGNGDLRKNLMAIRNQLEKLGANVKIHRSCSPGPSLKTRNSDGQEAHIRSLKHLDSSQVTAGGI
jgi:hypothetical protein